jgi:hypothetical protein
VEALYFGATTAGERDAAEAAAERLKAKLEEASRHDPPIEMKFSLPDEWSVRLFIALCRRYGVRPFRYRSRWHRVRRCVRAPRWRSAPGRSQRGSQPAFILLAGTVQILFFRSISDHRAPKISPDRAAVMMQTSKASTAVA